MNKPAFQLNRHLDLDRDGIVCEVIKKTATPAPSTVPSQAVSVPDSYLHAQLPLSECQLKETENIEWSGAKGFPLRNQIPVVGDVKIAIIPVDFSNAPGVGNPGQMFADDLTKITRWGKYFSRGKLNYIPELASNGWVRAPRGADWYVHAESGKSKVEQKQSRAAALEELVRTTDPIYDFAGTDFIYFVFPYKAEREFGTAIYSHLARIDTADGQIEVTAYGEMAGFAMPSDMNRADIWDHLIHEVLHFQGQLGHGPMNGSGLGIMSDQWGASKAVTGWEGFLSGWFGEDEVLCLDAGSLQRSAVVTMSSIDLFGPGPELVLVKLNAHEAVAIEYRSPSDFTNLSQTAEIGEFSALVAYRLDVNAPLFRDDSDPNGDLKNFWWFIRDSGKLNIKKSATYKQLSVVRLNEKQVRIQALAP